MKKSIILIISIVIILMLIIIPFEVNSNATNPIETTCVYENIIPRIFYYPQKTSTDTLAMIEDCNLEISNLKSSVNLYAADSIDTEIARILLIQNYYKTDYEILIAEEAKWEKRYKEYPIATEVWIYMKTEFNWSDEVCAGIIGNIMGEIGGGTLNFNNWNFDKNTYGMFQWLGGRKKSIKQIYGVEPTIVEQLEFMYDELYGTDGVRQQVTDNQREIILNGTSPEQVAISFCNFYERPGGTGLPRKGYARKAYNYFVD